MTESGKTEREKVRTTLEGKKEIIRKHKIDVHVSDLDLQYGLAKS